MSAGRGKTGEAPLCELVRHSLDRYFEDLNGQLPADLYDLVIDQVERPLFEIVMRETGGNMSRAADMLGMNRATLRNRLEKHGLKKQR
ncbi:MAG: helix-turn-helix domain-containing protein [Gammaproteobacteria bacterium]